MWADVLLRFSSLALCVFGSSSTGKEAALLPTPSRPAFLVTERGRSQDAAIGALPASAGADADEEGVVGRRFLLGAIARMPQPLPTDACRVFHGRGGLYPGCEHLSLDWYPPVFVLTSFRELPEDELKRFHSALSDRWARRLDTPSSEEEELRWVYQCRNSSSPLETTTRLMSGFVPNPHVVAEAGGTNRFLVRVDRGLNHGLFLDMALGRTYVQDRARGERILNLFAYTCSFSVAALRGGASEVVNVDMSRGALSVGKRNHELNGFGGGDAAPGGGEGKARFLGHDVFKTWGKIRKLGPFGIVVVDPPSYQKGSFIASKDYAKVVRRLPSLLRPGGRVLLCLNAPELDTAFLRDRVAEEAPELRFVERLPDAPGFEAADRERALKVLVYELPERMAPFFA